MIVTAKKRTKLPFDLSDFPVIFWNTADDLMRGIKKQIAARQEHIKPVKL